MNKVQLIRNSVANQLYEWGLTSDTTNRYDMPTDTLIKIINKSSWNIEIDKKKLIYFTRHDLIPAPKKLGLTSALGGTAGHHKLKVSWMIWYLYQLQNRGFKHDEMKLHIYNYFSNKMPPKPVDNTPLEERILYTLRLNNQLPCNLPIIEDYILYTKKLQIPCWKVSTVDFENDNTPIYRVLVPKGNLTTQEAHLLSALRTDEQFIKEEGHKIISVVDGIVTTKYLENLMIFKKYAMKIESDSTNYLELLNKTINYDSI